jgi:hypothetical protein
MSVEGRVAEYWLFAIIESEEEREKICSRLRRLGGLQVGSTDGLRCEFHQIYKCEVSSEADVSHPVLTRIITTDKRMTRLVSIHHTYGTDSVKLKRVVQYWGGEYRREEKTTHLMSLTISLKCLLPDSQDSHASNGLVLSGQEMGPDHIHDVSASSNEIIRNDVHEYQKIQVKKQSGDCQGFRDVRREELAAVSLVGSLGYKFFTAYTRKGYFFEISNGILICAEIVQLIPEDSTIKGPLKDGSWFFTLHCAGGEVNESHLISLSLLLDE